VSSGPEILVTIDCVGAWSFPYHQEFVFIWDREARAVCTEDL
jgi:hypothetical protein